MLRLLLLILLTTLLLYCNNCFCEIKAVQISYLNVKSYTELDKEFKKIKKKGFNTVIFRVFHNKGDRFYPFVTKINAESGLYFKSKYLLCVNDCLKKVARLAHKNRLKLIAWMQTRYLDFIKFKSDRKVFKYDFKRKKIVLAKGLSFFNEKNFYFILKVYYDLLKYPIDGILFQDDLKILIDEDFNPYAINKFYKITKIKLSNKNINKVLFGNAVSRKRIKPTKYFYTWLELKSKQIKKFLNFLTFNIKTRKKIKIFMNVGYEFLLNPKLNLKWYGYSYDVLKNSFIDKFVVMMYQEQMKRELKISLNQYYKIAKQIIITGKKIGIEKFVFKIQSYNWYSHKTIKIGNILTFLEINNIKNIAIFPYYKNMF